MGKTYRTIFFYKTLYDQKWRWSWSWSRGLLFEILGPSAISRKLDAELDAAVRRIFTPVDYDNWQDIYILNFGLCPPISRMGDARHFIFTDVE